MLIFRLFLAVSFFVSVEASADLCTLKKLFSGPEIAENAGLHYIDSYPPAISRSGDLDAWVYTASNGQVITDEAELERIKRLHVPDVYHDVWISEDPESHIQATAIDEKGRKQYRYHPAWVKAKSNVKFSRMMDFKSALPKIHDQEAIDLAKSGLPKAKVLATVATLMEKTGIRVGSEEYARDNSTYGLTTFLKSKNHLTVDGDQIHFNFVGKASKDYANTLVDPEIASTIKSLDAAPGDNLFQYQDEAGKFHPITAEMLNDYLGTTADGHFTAKDFRTWSGTKFATKSLMEKPFPKNQKIMEANIKDATVAASDFLNNTPFVAKKNYIDQRILAAYADPVRFEKAKQAVLASPDPTESPEEQMITYLLTQ